MMLPLADSKILKSKSKGGNCGLVWNKFVNKWLSPAMASLGDFKGLGENKKDWVKEFVGRSADASTVTARVRRLAEAIEGEVCNYTTTGPFVTGMGLSSPVENGFLWHHTLGVPYLPGSSIKGMIRAWAEEWCQEDMETSSSKSPSALTKKLYQEYIETIWRLFGGPIKDKDGKEIKPAAAGNIIVFDALPVDTLTLYAEVITPHTGDWRITKTPENSPPADWISPVPIPFLAVAPNAKFQFALAPRKGAEPDDLEKALKYLEAALEWIGAGAKTSVGFGRFESDEAKKRKEEKILAEYRQERKLIKSGFSLILIDGAQVKLVESHHVGSGNKMIVCNSEDGEFSISEEEVENWNPSSCPLIS